jgi:phosphoribosylformimino-5-aminoimidazole carboxamide ribotide isomerase
MRVIPVIDLLNGQAVHAIKGERNNYKPLKSVLCKSSDPLTVALAFRDLMGLNEIYIADLNAIQHLPQIRHREIIAELGLREGMNIILDAGISEFAHARDLFDIGISKAVIGAETLHTWDAVKCFPIEINPARLVFSLDLHSREILSQCSFLSAMTPVDALEYLQSAGWRDVILLDLARVGTADGADRTLVAEVRAKLPDLNCLVGGGVAHPNELIEMESLGVAGILVATAIHRGIINAGHIASLARHDT